MNDNWEALEKAARNISKSQLWEDLLHLVIEDFLQKENLQEILDSGGARYYIVRMMLNQLNSSTSPFYIKFKKNKILDQKRLEIYPDEWLQLYLEWKDEPMQNGIVHQFHLEFVDPELENEEEMLQKNFKAATEALEKLDWYDKMLFKTFVEEGHTVSSLSRSTRIPRTSVSLTINRVREYLKQEINKATK